MEIINSLFWVIYYGKGGVFNVINMVKNVILNWVGILEFVNYGNWK